ncbi:MAG: ThiF family adenylyltransferase [Paludibacter sp.]|nr:ThiF family adenylyltransferase [Paludibacter sp.]
MENKFSIRFPDYNLRLLSKDISSSIAQIEAIIEENSLRVFKINEGTIGLSFNLKIPLPSRSTVCKIDIRQSEPVFVVISLTNFKFTAPRAYSDRIDFPSEKLPHLNPVGKGEPANFCLHRGDINEWYAEHTLFEFVERIREWLRDAAGNRLIKIGQGDFFEITRITDSIGYNIYKHSDFVNTILFSYKNNGLHFSYVWYEVLKEDPLVTKKDAFSMKSLGVTPEPNLEKVVDLSKKINGISDSKNNLKKLNIGIFLFPDEDFTPNEYFSVLPSNYEDFENWCIELKLPIKEAVSKYLSNNYQCLNSIPITIAIRRPKNLINSDINIEFLNFLVFAGGDFTPIDNIINPKSKVYILENRKPVTLEFAKELSKNNSDTSSKKTLFIGCGAIGSKLILHLAKSGHNNYDLVDDDNLSPHNLIRHGLLTESVGKNKADALKNEISNIFYADTSNLKIEAHNTNGQNFLRAAKGLSKYKELIDTTASNNFQMYLSDLDLPLSIKCIRCEIAFDGRLGFLKSEGNNRNPRLDDLNVALIDSAIDNQLISDWLQDYKSKSENGNFEFEEINIGVSCNSNTLRLADDIISLHTACFSIALKKLKDYQGGFIQITNIDTSAKNSITTEILNIEEFHNLRFANDSNWRLRIRGEVVNEIKKDLISNIPNETGGLLIGKIDSKRKVIYVTRFTKAPSDSIKKPYFFTRGTNNVPEEIEFIRDKTGNLIDYVGEWHSHPNGSSQLSDTDRQAISELRATLDKVPYPTFIIIATPSKLNPYIFGPKSLIH